MIGRSSGMRITRERSRSARAAAMVIGPVRPANMRMMSTYLPKGGSVAVMRVDRSPSRRRGDRLEEDRVERVVRERQRDHHGHGDERQAQRGHRDRKTDDRGRDPSLEVSIPDPYPASAITASEAATKVVTSMPPTVDAEPPPIIMRTILDRRVGLRPHDADIEGRQPRGARVHAREQDVEQARRCVERAERERIRPLGEGEHHRSHEREDRVDGQGELRVQRPLARSAPTGRVLNDREADRAHEGPRTIGARSRNRRRAGRGRRRG